MFTLPIKYKYKDMENLMDKLMENPVVILKDANMVKSLGIHAKPLRKMKMLHISHDRNTNESSCILKCNNYYIPGNMVKVKDHHKIKYIFDFTNIPKL